MNDSSYKKNALALFLVLFTFWQSTAQSNLTGTITDAGNGLGLIGVSIVIQGTNTGTITDLDGNFELKTERTPPYKLVISYTGYRNQVIDITDPNQVVTATLTEGLLLGDVVVTARKRQEPLQLIPIAINAFSGEVMQELGVQNAGDVALLTPNFTWNTEFGNASPQPYLRGIGTNNFSPINNGPIAVYQDNVFIGPNIAQGFATFDVQRAEVLKGPQGTLYGRNSTGGLINFISVKPKIGGGTNGFVNVEGGQYGTFNFEGALGFETGGKSAARVSFVRNKNSGTWDNVNPNGGNANVTSDLGVRLQWAANPSDKVSILFNAHLGKANPDTAPFKNIGLFQSDGVTPFANPGVGAGGATADFTESFVDERDYYTTSKGADFENVDTRGAFLQLDFDLNDDLTLHSLTSYDYAEIRRHDDVDDGSIGIEDDYYADDFNWFSQEVRLSGAQWHLGGYFYNETAQGVQIWTNPIFGNGEGNVHDIATTSFALFGQYDYSINDKVSLSGGLRWSYEQKDVRRYDGFMPLISSTANGGDGPLFSLDDVTIDQGHGITVGTPNKKDWNAITGRVSLDYKTDDGNLLYASISRGFKGGDVNGAAFLDEYVASAGPGQSDICPGEEAPGSARCAESVANFQRKIVPVDPEFLNALEVGFKANLADNKLRINGALFYYDYQDQQNTILVSVPGSGGPGTTTLENAASSKFPGADLEISYGDNGWFFQTTFGWLDAEYDDFGENTGNQISLTPKYQGSLLGRYSIPFENGGKFTLQADLSYQGKTYFQPTNIANLEQDPYSLLGARLSYTAPKENWSVAVFGRNLTGEEYLGSGFDVSVLGWLAVKPGPRRYFGASINYSF